MTNAATVGQDEVMNDPNKVIELEVTDRANAGRAPTTAWGKIQFDDDGKGKCKVPLKDVAKLHELRWLSPEDQEKYLGISQEAAIEATQSDVAEVQARLDAATSANARLAAKNAELEAKVDELLAKYQKEFKAYDDKVHADMKAISDSLDKVRADNDALAAENASLKAQVASLTPAPAAETKTDAKSDETKKDSAKKAGK